MSRHRQWLATTLPCDTVDWSNPNIEALEQQLVCTVTNISVMGEAFGTLRLRFASGICESAIRKRMENGIDTLVPLHKAKTCPATPKKRKRVKTKDAQTQVENPAHADVIEKIKAMKARVAFLEQENLALRDRNDINYIASYLD